MRASVIITHYQQKDYIREAVDSVLTQTLPVDEIIIVDDGSDTATQNYLKEQFGSDGRIQLVFQENAGQMVAIERTLQKTSADIILFLDGDDCYAPDHWATIAAVFNKNPRVDFVSTGFKFFGNRIESVLQKGPVSRTLGYSIIGSYYAKHKIGGPTSCLALKRNLLASLMPFPQSWSAWGKCYAEIPLVIGSSILGAYKYYLARPSMLYRAHANNLDLDKPHDHGHHYRIELLYNLVCEHYRQRADFPDFFLKNALTEFKTIELPMRKEWSAYCRLIMRSNQSISTRLKQVWCSYQHWHSFGQK